VKFTVHTEAVLAIKEVGAVEVNEIAVGYVAAVRVGAVPVGLTGVVSSLVAREKVVNTSVEPFTTATLRVAAVESASAQVLAPLFASVTTMTLASLGSEAVAEQFVTKLDGVFSTTAGVVEIAVNPDGKVNVM
jgi:hypothetical protein